MRKSTHYEFNLVEGSDIVNPLVQDVPNYERIDEELYKNSNIGIPMATELLSGTVHELTRENPNSPMFRFVATSNFKTGETFTVDGVQVTALLTSGETLPNGCYVINANVLCCLVGTVLTMFCANKLSDVFAVDSEKLGGELPAFYATAQQVANAITIAQSANDISLANERELALLKNTGMSYNPDDDYIYINGVRWKYAGIIAHSLIPILTGYTGTNGKVVYTSIDSSGGYEPWKAFDGSENTIAFGCNGALTASYIGYQFNNKVNIKRIEIGARNSHNDGKTITTIVQYYNGVNWIDIPSTSVTFAYNAQERKPLVYDLDLEGVYGIAVRMSCNQTVTSSFTEIKVLGTEI